MKARLQDKFVRNFIFPLLCGIFVSISFTVCILLLYARGLSTSTDLIKIVQEADNNKTEPIISNVCNILYRKLQTPINVLLGLKEYYLFLVSSGNLEMNDRGRMIEFINKYMFNELDMRDNYNQTLNYISRNGNESYLDYANWFLDQKSRNVTELSDTALKQLYIQTNMNLVFKSHYELNIGDPTKEYKLMYTAFPYTKLFTSYPVVSLGEDYYEKFEHFVNPSWCRDDNLEVPDYYYFFCRPWFKDIKSFHKDQDLDAMVTTPYLSISGRSEITLCIRFNDTLLSIDDENNYVVFCLDIDTRDIYYVFDEYNNLLSGYFLIMRVKSDIPFYFPNIMNLGNQGNIINFEYYLNVSYYLDDINSYGDVIEKFTYNINSTEYLNNPIPNEGQYLKAGENNTYKLYPVLFNLNDEPTKPQHLLTIVYVTVPQSYMNIIYKFQKNLYPRLLFQIVIFIIMGSILILISRYLIKSIAINIVKPIRMMKRMLEGMNNKKLSQFAENNFELNTTNQIERDLHEEEEENDEEEEENQIIKEDENDDDEDEDEYIETRSTDIENLFLTLLNLKKVLTFTQDTSLAVNNENILNFLFAKHTFNEVKNLKGKFLCDSNVGNIALKCRKYDKAILHLVEAIKDPQNYVSSLAKKSIRVGVNSKLSSKNTFKYSSKKLTSKIGNVFNKVDMKKMELIKKKFLDSRYPKLIYSFKKYYKNLSKLLKNKTVYDSVISQDFFAVKERHSLEQYQNIVEEYYLLSGNCNDKKKEAEALLEVIEFGINYKLKSFLDNKLKNKSEDNLTEDIKKNKEIIIFKIVEGFKKFDFMITKLMKNVNVNEYLKKILEMINVTRKDSSEIIETPTYILNQKANYLKGKFCYYCENYTQALKFFIESKKLNVISNAVIIRDSIKKAKKVLNIVSSRIDLQVEELKNVIINEKIPEVKKLRTEQLGDLNDNKLKAFEFYSTLDSELKKYKTTPKDVAVMINFASSLDNDTKQIDQAIAIAEYIFENLTTSDDRFTLFAYTSHANPLINLSYKNISTINYIRDQFDKFSDKDYYEEFSNDSQSNIIKAAENAYEYLIKKSFREVREKWIIGVTMDINEEDCAYLKENNAHEKLFDSDNNTNFVIIFTNKNKKLLEINDRLNFNKSGVIESTELETLKKKMKIMGTINDDIVFLQEKYDNFNKSY